MKLFGLVHIHFLKGNLCQLEVEWENVWGLETGRTAIVTGVTSEPLPPPKVGKGGPTSWRPAGKELSPLLRITEITSAASPKWKLPVYTTLLLYGYVQHLEIR